MRACTLSTRVLRVCFVQDRDNRTGEGSFGGRRVAGGDFPESADGQQGGVCQWLALRADIYPLTLKRKIA